MDGCLIEGNELGLYIQHEPLFTLTNTAINGNTSCGARVTDCGLVCINNSFSGNFTAHMALDCAPLTYQNNRFTQSEDIDMFIRGGAAIKLIDNQFDGDIQSSIRFQNAQTPLR